MPVRVFQLNDLLPLDDAVVKKHLADFLCDASEPGQDSILTRPDFQPDSFSIQERFRNPCFLSEKERDGHSFLTSEVAAQIRMLQADNVIVLEEPERCVDFIVDQIERLLSFRTDDGELAAQVYNQEITDVSRRVIAYCLSGGPNYELRTHQAANRLAKKVIPALIERHLVTKKNLKELLALSIASGLIGLDVKGKEAAASPIMASGIALGPFLGSSHNANEIADALDESIDEIVSKGFSIDHWDLFVEEALSGKPFRLAWFTDDVIETMFDLLLVQKMLDQNSALTISLIPKNGYYGNDASFKDVTEMLEFPVFAPALSHVESGRLIVLTKGPLMGTGNARKFSRENVEEIRRSDAVYIKGCRIHEMLQGGIDAVAYTSFVVAREFTESETGLDSRDTPLAFFRNEPGEYAYWGFKGRERCRKTFADGRTIMVCYSTLEDHERRRTTTDPDVLTSDLGKLRDLWAGLEPEYRYACGREMAFIEDQLAKITC